MSRLVDKITRTCYNNNNNIIAIQQITVRAHQVSTLDGAGRALVTNDSLSLNRFNEAIGCNLTTEIRSQSGVGGDKTISYIVTSGRFTSHTDNINNDVDTVTYNQNAPLKNIVVDIVNMPGILKEGDTIP